MSFLRRHGLWLLLAGLVAAGLWRMRLDVDVLNLLPPDQPDVQGLKLYQEHFANARELIVSLRAPDAEQAEQRAGELAARLRALSNQVAGAAWQPPWLEHPEQVAEVVAALWFNQSPEVFGELTNRLAPGRLGTLLASAKEALTTSLSPMDIARRAFDPYDLLSVPGAESVGGLSPDQGQRMFASDDGALRVLFVEARSELGGYASCAAWLAEVQQVVAGLRAGNAAWDGVVVRTTGRPAFVTEIASNMRRDLLGSVLGTTGIIALLFWLAHRRWLPMLWLLALLGLILVAALALGGLILGQISVISMGFAAVLLGLAVDYAVVHYQEALAHPGLSVPEIRRAIAPSILWAAITTIAAFLVLNLSGLPGLAQLGSLVGIGVALAAWVMVMAFLPPLFPDRRGSPDQRARPPWRSYFVAPFENLPAGATMASGPARWPGLLCTGIILLSSMGLLCLKRPGLDRSSEALRPQQQESESALREVTEAIGLPKDPMWVIVKGSREPEVFERLSRAQAVLQGAQSNGVIRGVTLPTALWPREEHQAANRAAARLLASSGPRLREAALAHGFNTNALFLTDGLLRVWERAGQSPGVFWPTNDMSRWLFKQFMARTTNEWLVMGMVQSATNRNAMIELGELSTRLAAEGVFLSGWELLGSSTLQKVRGRLWLVVAPMVGLVLLSLWLAFRRLGEVLLGLGVMLMSGLVLLAMMALAGWSWNLLNLMALPLILGTGVDYSLFIQLGMRRQAGDAVMVRRSIGRALLLCGGTAIAGFGSLAWSGNVGLASLGKVCAVGIAANMLIAIYLLPDWWRALAARRIAPSAPSSFYRAWLWRAGLGLVRFLPTFLLRWISLTMAGVYHRLHRLRREVVVANLLPVVCGNLPQARRAARRLFREFALKMLDLWRFESGRAVESRFNHEGDLRLLHAARQRGQGVLVVMPHLGNWEIGAPALVRHGINLVVLTQPEPDSGLTELRRASRARWGIETLVVGDQGFAFVEVIKRLQEGAVVALLIDRPPSANAVTIELFGRPFRASIAPAELARASGCAVVGGVVVRTAHGYVGRIEHEFAYDRRALGQREARRAFVQQIMRAFEPAIRQYPEQWFHFIPIWPEKAQSASSNR